MRYLVVPLLVTLWPVLTMGDAPTFKIGVSLPLSGAFAEYGEAVRNGMELALEDQPALRSKIKFLYEDNAYDPKKAVGTLQKLVDVDGINLFLVWGNEPALSVAPVAEQRKIPTIAIAQYPQVSMGRNYVIRFLNSGEQYSETLLAYLRNEKIKRIAVVKSELSFFNMLTDGLKHLAESEQIDVVDSFLPTETDFRPSILKLKARSFDILGLYLTSPQVGLFLKQANELGFRPKTFGATPFESKGVIASAWPLMDGAVYTHNAVTADFSMKYTERFNTDMQLAYAANAYDFVGVTGSLLAQKADFSSPPAILSSYASVKPGSGASGNYRFVDSPENGRHFEFDIVVRKIYGGNAEEVFRSNFGSGPKG
jgi:branched-chain amino acid transport system substrate-binding protein